MLTHGNRIAMRWRNLNISRFPSSDTDRSDMLGDFVTDIAINPCIETADQFDIWEWILARFWLGC
jgi:hypothetical protein